MKKAMIAKTVRNRKISVIVKVKNDTNDHFRSRKTKEQ